MKTEMKIEEIKTKTIKGQPCLGLLQLVTSIESDATDNRESVA